jgi:hypothetical protein
MIAEVGWWNADGTEVSEWQARELTDDTGTWPADGPGGGKAR